MRVCSEHACYGGIQGFCVHGSRTCATEMRFPAYRPPHAKTSAVRALYYLAGLTSVELTLHEGYDHSDYFISAFVTIICGIMQAFSWPRKMSARCR